MIDGLFWVVFSVSRFEENFEKPGAFTNYIVFNPWQRKAFFFLTFLTLGLWKNDVPTYTFHAEEPQALNGTCLEFTKHVLNTHYPTLIHPGNACCGRTRINYKLNFKIRKQKLREGG